MSTQTRPRVSTKRKPQEDPACAAERHGTYRAYVLGCVCPSAQAARVRHDEMRSTPERRERDRRTAQEYDEREAWVLRVTGGRLRLDPRIRWRGKTHAVDRFNVDAMVNGYDVPSTLGEKIAAIARLEGRIVSASAYSWRRIGGLEIAAKLHLSDDREVYRVRQNRKKLAAERTQRRLADSIWRAAIVAAAQDKRRG
jgi:hypothetical protein